MKLKLFYNGNPEDTKIMNAETGEAIDGVTSVAVEVDAFGCNAIVSLKNLNIDIDNSEAIVIEDDTD